MFLRIEKNKTDTGNDKEKNKTDINIDNRDIQLKHYTSKYDKTIANGAIKPNTTILSTDAVKINIPTGCIGHENGGFTVTSGEGGHEHTSHNQPATESLQVPKKKSMFSFNF